MEPIQDVSEAQFEAQVLAQSRERPVVVDFWAGWCAPCRMLGPVLEREVLALGGRVALAKVDVDQAQSLAQQFNVRGIPAVMAFRDGQVVAEFTGARDAAFVKRWLEGLAPSKSKEALERATSSSELELLVDDPEVGTEARLRLVRLLLEQGAVARAEALLEALPASDERVQPLRALAAFARDAAAPPAPEGLEASWARASGLAARGDYAGALEQFLEIVKRDRKFKADGARKAMLALFELAGQKSDLTREFRHRLMVYL